MDLATPSSSMSEQSASEGEKTDTTKLSPTECLESETQVPGTSSEEEVVVEVKATASPSKNSEGEVEEEGGEEDSEEEVDDDWLWSGTGVSDDDVSEQATFVVSSQNPPSNRVGEIEELRAGLAVSS